MLPIHELHRRLKFNHYYQVVLSSLALVTQVEPVVQYILLHPPVTDRSHAVRLSVSSKVTFAR
jgi:hypothetical protein